MADLAQRRSVPLALPLPIVEAMRRLNGGQHVNMDRAFWFNGYHLNELGHRILTALATHRLLTLFRALQANHYTSFSDPAELPNGLAAVLPSLLDPQSLAGAKLPAPLSAQLLQSDAHLFTCAVMYHPYNPWASAIDQTMAEFVLSVESDRNRGWWYSRHGQSNKFAMSINSADAHVVVQHIRLAFHSSVHSFSIVYVRSWNSSMMGEATVWLTCEQAEQADMEPNLVPTATQPSVHTPPVVLNGSWAQPNTQLDLMQIWPLPWARETSDAEMRVEQPACELRYGHVLHTGPGEFRLVGFVWN